MQSPISIGEFGPFMRDNSCNDWLRDVTNLFGKSGSPLDFLSSGKWPRLTSSIYSIPVGNPEAWNG